MKTNFLENFSQLTGATKGAFERMEMARRGGSETEIERAVRLAFQAERRERRHCCGDPVERVLADPQQRLLWNAIGRLIAGARMDEAQQKALDEFRQVTKDAGITLTQASPMGQLLFPIPVNPDVWDLLLTYGAFRDLGVRTVSSSYERFAMVTGLPSAIFITPGSQGSSIPGDQAMRGTSLFAPSNTVGSLLPVSWELFEDMKTDVAAAVLSRLSMGLAARLDFAAFVGNGVDDQLNGGQTGIFNSQGIGLFVPAQGVTSISRLSRNDFVNTIGAVTPAALQRADKCRWFMSPALLPALMMLIDGQGPNYLLKTPAETHGEWNLTGFPVTWAAQAPSANQAGASVSAFGEQDAYVVAVREMYELQRAEWRDNSTFYYYRALMRAYCAMRNAAGFAVLQLAQV